MFPLRSEVARPFSLGLTVRKFSSWHGVCVWYISVIFWGQIRTRCERDSVRNTQGQTLSVSSAGLSADIPGFCKGEFPQKSVILSLIVTNMPQSGLTDYSQDDMLGLHCESANFGPTEAPSWGHSRVVLGAIGLFLEPFCGHLSSKMTRSLGN